MSLVFTTLVLFGYLFGFLFASLSLACGLYYCAELVEEYTVATKRVITYTIYGIFALHILLWLEGGLPFTRIMISLGTLGLNSLLLPSFPSIDLGNPIFLSSCLMVIANHFMWFFYFTDHYHPFPEIASFFGICVWLVPFMFFISLSANEFTLPNFDPSMPGTRRASDDGHISPTREFNPTSRKKKGNVVKYVMDMILRRSDADSSFLGTSNPRKVF